MEWTPIINISCVVLTVTCTAWNVFDKIAERRPLAGIAHDKVQVSNPRKKALFLHRILFSGEPVLAFGESRNGYGEHLYEPVNNHIATVNMLVLASETKAIEYDFCLPKDHDFDVRLKRLDRFRWDNFDVHVHITKRTA